MGQLVLLQRGEDQQLGLVIVNVLQLCAPAIALFRKSLVGGCTS
jgi:hypothetical protein